MRLSLEEISKGVVSGVLPEKLENCDVVVQHVVHKMGCRIRKKITSELGIVDAVVESRSNNRSRYIVMCPVSGCDYQGQHVDSHLVSLHQWTRYHGRFFKSRQIRMFNFIMKLSHHGQHKPLPCSLCGRYLDRLDTHLKKTHGIATKKVPVNMQKARKLALKHAKSKSKQFDPT